MNRKQKVFLGFALCFLIILIIWVLDLHAHFNKNEFRHSYKQILDWHEQNMHIAPLYFLLLYTAIVALALPGADILAIIGGGLFPQPYSTVFAVIGSTLGGTILFLVAKGTFGDKLEKKAHPFLYKMENGFHKSPAGYLLFLRFIPIFPHWLINIAPAYFGIHLWTFIWTTFIGFIPISFVFTQAGKGIATLITMEEPFTLASVFNTQVNIALIALAIVALIPLFIKKLAKL